MIQRRGFLAGILAAACAPAFIGSKVLMPVRSLWVPPPVQTNSLITIKQITDEALRILEKERVFKDHDREVIGWGEDGRPMAWDYDINRQVTTFKAGGGIITTIRKPARFTGASI